MLDRACWTLAMALVLQDKHDDRPYFVTPTNPDNLGAITLTIDVSSERTGSPALHQGVYQLEAQRLLPLMGEPVIRSEMVPYSHDKYTKIYCVPL
jgi:hypothetical protein